MTGMIEQEQLDLQRPQSERALRSVLDGGLRVARNEQHDGRVRRAGRAVIGTADVKVVIGRLPVGEP
jgi:hypothetical protein